MLLPSSAQLPDLGTPLSAHHQMQLLQQLLQQQQQQTQVAVAQVVPSALFWWQQQGWGTVFKPLGCCQSIPCLEAAPWGGQSASGVGAQVVVWAKLGCRGWGGTISWAVQPGKRSGGLSWPCHRR